MVKDLFDSLLEDLGRTIAIPNLHPDRNNTCMINFPNGLQLYVEMDPLGRGVIIGSDLGAIPPGRYRENLFREALKTNGLPAPLNGVLAYSNKTDHLVIYEELALKELTGEKIADAIGPLSEKALKWKEALEKGEIPVVATFRTSGGMFGLRP